MKWINQRKYLKPTNTFHPIIYTIIIISSHTQVIKTNGEEIEEGSLLYLQLHLIFEKICINVPVACTRYKIGDVCPKRKCKPSSRLLCSAQKWGKWKTKQVVVSKDKTSLKFRFFILCLHYIDRMRRLSDPKYESHET